MDSKREIKSTMDGQEELFCTCNIYKWVKHGDMCMYCRDVLNVCFYFSQTFALENANQACNKNIDYHYDDDTCKKYVQCIVYTLAG